MRDEQLPTSAEEVAGAIEQFQLLGLSLDAFALIISLVAVVLVYLTLRANTKAVEAALKANEISARSQRPWITLEKFTDVADLGDGIVEIGAWFSNDGLSTATNVKLMVSWTAVPTIPLRDPRESETASIGVMGPSRAGMVHTSGVPLSAIFAGHFKIRVRAEYGWSEDDGAPFEYDCTFRLSGHLVNNEPSLRWSVVGMTHAT